MQDRSRGSGIWCDIILAGVLLIANVPFLDKRPHVDDVYYLAIARVIEEHPLDPYRHELVGIGGTASAVPNPPLWSYLLALGEVTTKLFGWSANTNVALHVLQSVIFAFLGVGIGRLLGWSAPSLSTVARSAWACVLALSPFLFVAKTS